MGKVGNLAPDEVGAKNLGQSFRYHAHNLLEPKFHNLLAF